MQQRQHVIQHRLKMAVAADQLLNMRLHPGQIAVQHILQQDLGPALLQKSKHFAHRTEADITVSLRDRLIGQTQ